MLGAGVCVLSKLSKVIAWGVRLVLVVYACGNSVVVDRHHPSSWTSLDQRMEYWRRLETAP